MTSHQIAIEYGFAYQGVSKGLHPYRRDDGYQIMIRRAEDCTIWSLYAPNGKHIATGAGSKALARTIQQAA